MWTKLSADELNLACACRTLDINQLRQILDRESSIDGFYDQLIKTHPNIFSDTVVFLSRERFIEISDVISKIESVLSLSSVQNSFLPMPKAFSTAGVCMGYDFHLTNEGPKLIEINTNSGGLMLNLELARAQHSCCKEMNAAFSTLIDFEKLEQVIFAMFMQEWQLQGRSGKPKTIAIVDTSPQQQFLYPEFQLFQELFKKYGVDAYIVDPSQIELVQDELRYQGIKIDLIYNRLTDFSLTQSEHENLRLAYEKNVCVFTPAPHHHQLFAKKSNLTYLSDESWLRSMSVDEDTIQVFKRVIPKTQKVAPELFDELWSNRKHLFFKPVSGFGSRAAYRGDKITKRVWDEICHNEYVAQEIALPSSRIVEVGLEKQNLKLDLRCYTYQGQIQLMAARLYDGQTTNFRTNGGGFASVFIMPN
jgi:hypothetical protein